MGACDHNTFRELRKQLQPAKLYVKYINTYSSFSFSAIVCSLINVSHQTMHSILYVLKHYVHLSDQPSIMSNKNAIVFHTTLATPNHPLIYKLSLLSQWLCCTARLEVLRGYHGVERDRPLVVEHFVAPSPNGANEFDCPNPIVGYQDLLYHSLASIATNKLPRRSYLKMQGKGGRGREKERRIMKV